VIKHCLHFFCKECIDKSFGFKKECPLCKKSMSTRRVLRKYDKINEILKLLQPFITDHMEREKQQYDNVTQVMANEQNDMRKIQEERISGHAHDPKSNSHSKKKRQAKFTEEMEDMLEINAVHRDKQETEE
jgi:hypothetical protein